MKTQKEIMREFLIKNYKADRFLLRDTPEWNYGGVKYQEVIIDSNIADLEKDGYFGISHFDAVDGVGGFWDQHFTKVNPFKKGE